MRYHRLIAPILGLAIAGVANAQTPTQTPAYPQPTAPQPTTPQPTTPQPGTPQTQPQPSDTSRAPQWQTPINAPATPTTSMGMNEPRRDPAEKAFVNAHVDTVLQGVTLSYAQFRRIDSTVTSQLATAGVGHHAMGAGREAPPANQPQASGHHDSLDTSARERLTPVLDQVDTAIRAVLTSAQQRTFDRNLTTWKSRRAR